MGTEAVIHSPGAIVPDPLRPRAIGYVTTTTAMKEKKMMKKKKMMMMMKMKMNH